MINNFLKQSFFIFIFFGVLITVSGQVEEPVDTVTTTGVTRCGAGTSVLRAESIFDGIKPVTYNWYEYLGGEFRLLGSLETGVYVTPTLIKSKSYYVSITVEGVETRLDMVSVTIENTAGIYENPIVSLCDSVILNSFTTFDADQLENATFQWQKYVVEDSGEGYYVDLSDSASRVGLDYTVYESGFFRVVITREDGCQAISESVEITPNNQIKSKIVSDSLICFVEGEYMDTYISSEFSREITHFEWEESLDSVNFYVVGSDSVALKLRNPTPPGDERSVRYYRLTVKEENCSKKSEIVKLIWSKVPEGVIEHSGSTNDFFYCHTDLEQDRVIYVNTLDFVSVSWWRVQELDGLSLEQIKNQLPNWQKLYWDYNFGDDYFSAFEKVGVGDSLVLGEHDWGLYVARMINLQSGCYNYSNFLFADSAIPVFEMMPDVLCVDLNTVNFIPYDNTADEYHWFYSEDGVSEYSEISSDSVLVVSSDSVFREGWYYLSVLKNECYAQSDPQFLEEVEIPFPTISLSSGGDEVLICPGEVVEMVTDITPDDYFYFWASFATGDSVLHQGKTFTTSTPGDYYLIFGKRCYYATNTISVQYYDLPSDSLRGVTSDSLYCQSTTLELVDVRDDDQYQWYFSDGGGYGELVSDTSAIFTDNIGSYFVAIETPEGCLVYSDTIEISALLEPALLEVSDSIMLCGSSPSYELATSPSPGHEFVWLYLADDVADFDTLDRGENIYRQIVNQQGLYEVRIFDGSCMVSSKTYVTINSDPEEDFDSYILGDSVICGGEIILESSYTSEDAIYRWEYSLDSQEFELLESDSSQLLLNSTFLDGVKSGDSTSIFVRLFLNDGRCRDLSLVKEIRLYEDILPVIYNVADLDEEQVIYCTEEITLEVKHNWSGGAELGYQWQLMDKDSLFQDLVDATSRQLKPENDGVYRCVVFPLVDGHCVDTSNVIWVRPSHKVELYDEPLITLCGNDPSYTLSANLVTNATYQWFYQSFLVSDFSLLGKGEEMNAFEVSDEGFYKLVIAFEGCELTSDTIKITHDDTKPSPTVAVDGESVFCDVTNAEFRSTHVREGATYRWTYSVDGGDSYQELSDKEVLILEDGFISSHMTGDLMKVSLKLYVSDDGCQSVSEPKEVYFYNQVNARVVNPDGTEEGVTYCQDSELGFQLFAQTNLVEAEYQWQIQQPSGEFEDIDLGILSSYQPSGSGVYRCLVQIPGSSCMALSNVIKVETTPKAIFSSDEDQQLCAGQAIELLVDPGEQDPAMIDDFGLQWYYSDGTDDFIAIMGATAEMLIIEPGDDLYGSGQFFYVASNAKCATSSDTISFYVEKSFAFDLESHPATCLGLNDGQIVVTPTNEVIYEYVLNDTLSQSSSVFDSLGVGVYQLTLASPVGCRITTEIEVGQSMVVELLVEEVGAQRAGIPFQMEASGADRYEWAPSGYFHQPDDAHPTVLIPVDEEADTIYVDVYGYTNEGCMAYERLSILMESVEDYVFSKIVTPNGDGFNDYFEVLTIEDAENITLTVFDNWGREIFTVDGYENGADDAYRLSRLLQEGVYFYIYKVDSQVFKGSFYCKP